MCTVAWETSNRASCPEGRIDGSSLPCGPSFLGYFPPYENPYTRDSQDGPQTGISGDYISSIGFAKIQGLGRRNRFPIRAE